MSHLAQKTVYVVDDSEIVLELVRDALESAEYRVETMSNWQELDNGLKGKHPDLILMDVRMPDAYGDTALSFFKQERGLKHTPILLLSDLPIDELHIRSVECDADGYISKSWGVDRIITEVDKHIL